MGTDTAVADLPGTAPALPEGTAPAADQQEQLYRFSTWLHVGPGSQNCEAVNEEAGTNECSNPLHFHAWCRLPNQFQIRDIRDLAFAAKARRARQMRSDGSDAFEVLESDMDELLRGGDATKDQLIEELVGKDWWSDYLEAAMNAREIEAEPVGDAEPEKRFAHIDQDQARFKELADVPEDQRGDEYAELESHLGAYGQAVEEELAKIVEPKKRALAAKEVSDLVDMVRQDRIEAAASEEFMHTYAMHSWLIGARRARGGWPRFENLAALRDAPAEVVAGLKETFEDLEQTERGVASGNS